MRKRFKVLISVLLLMAMLGSMIPATAFTVAAATGEFHYELDTSGGIDPSAEYLIINTTADGTAYALAPESNAAGGNVNSTKAIQVNVSGGQIAGNATTQAAEWKFMETAAAQNNAPYIFMVYNPSTHSFLWNPDYESEVNTVGTAITPVQDDYNGQTMAVFNFPLNTATNTEGLLDVSTGSVSGSVAYSGQWLTHTAPAGGDGNFMVNFGPRTSTQTDLSPVTWKYLAYTDYGTADGNGYTGVNKGRLTGVFTDTSTKAGPDGAYMYNSPNQYKKWWGSSIDLYTSIGNDGWKSGNIERIRIDPYNEGGDKNKVTYVDSLVLGKTVRGIQTMAAYRQETAALRAGGQMPSVEYPFCQVQITPNGQGWNIKFYSNVDANNNVNGYANCLVPASSTASATKSETETASYLYKKVIEGDFTWTLVNDLEDGGDYILFSRNTDGTGYFYGYNTSEGTASFNDRVLSSGSLATAMNYANYTFTAVKAGVDSNNRPVYWLANNHGNGNFRYFLVDDGTTAYNVKRSNATDRANEYGSNYLWRYDSSSNQLYATHPDKSCAIGSGVSYGYINNDNTNCNFARGNSSAKIYLLKKTYHTHTGSVSLVSTTPATCETDGVKTYRYSGCGHTYDEVIPHTGHNYSGWTQNDASTHKKTCPNAGCEHPTVTEAHSLEWISTGNGENDKHYQKCNVCGYTSAQVTHNWNDGVVHNPTCTEAGYTIYTCQTCFATRRVEGASAGGQHTLDTGVLVTDPTCKTDGVMKYTCTVCGEEVTGPIDKVGHYYDASGNCVMGCTSSDAGHYNASYAESGDIRYYYVDEPEDGHTYAIANKNAAGSGYLASATDGDGDSAHDTIYLQSVPTTISNDAGKPFVTNVGKTMQWLYDDAKTFYNAQTSEYLWGKHDATGDYKEWIHRNIGSIEANNNDYSAYTTFKTITPATGTSGGNPVSSGVGTRIVTQDDYYLGFKDVVSTKGYTIPGKGNVEFSSSLMVDPANQARAHYLPVGGYVGTDGVKYFVNHVPQGGNDNTQNLDREITGNCTIDFDYKFTDKTSVLTVMRPDTNNNAYGVRITMVGNDIFVLKQFYYQGPGESYARLRQKCVAHASIDGLTYNTWHHFRLVSSFSGYGTDFKDSYTAYIEIDGVRILSVTGWAFYVPDDSSLGWPTFRDAGNASTYKIFTLFAWSYVNNGTLGYLDWTNAELDALLETSGINADTAWPPATSDSSLVDTYVDNLYVTSYDSQGEFNIYDTFDRYFDENGNVRNDGNIFYIDETAQIRSNTNDQQININGAIAKNVFVADTDNTNRVYLYDKRYGYTVNYFYGTGSTPAITEHNYIAMPVGSAPTFSSSDKHSYNGTNYKFDHITIGSNGAAATANIGSGDGRGYQKAMSTNTNENVINVYYKVEEKYSYTIEYYNSDNAGNYSSTPSSTSGPFGNITANTNVNVPSNCPTGYAFDKIEIAPAANGTVVNNSTVTVNGNLTIKVYYKITNVSYTILYYKNGVVDTSLTENKSVPYGSPVTWETTAYPKKTIEHYHHVSHDPGVTSLTVQTTFNVYYEKDTHSYTVEYYFDDNRTDNYVIDSSLTYTGSAPYGTELHYGGENSNYPDRGKSNYGLDHRDDDTTLTGDGLVLKVYYKRLPAFYQVQYYYYNAGNGTYEIDNDMTYDGEGLCGDTIVYGTTAYPYGNKTGFTRRTTTPYASDPENVVINTYINGPQVIKVYFDKQVYNYKIEYSIDGEHDESLDETGTAADGTEITVPDKKPFGYDPDPNNPVTPIIATQDDQVIEINYNRAIFAAPVTFVLDYADTIVYFNNYEDLFTKSDNYSGSFNKFAPYAAYGSIECNKIFTDRQITEEAAIGLYGQDVPSSVDWEEVGGYSIMFGEGGYKVTTASSNFEIHLIAEYYVYQGDDSGYIYQDITMVPATTIYFEDTNPFVKFYPETVVDPDTNEILEQYWFDSYVKDGEDNIVYAADALYDKLYGGCNELNESTTLLYSGGSSKKCVISEQTDTSKTVSFTFTGTGFDVISHANVHTGMVFVDVIDNVNYVQDGQGNYTNEHVGYYYFVNSSTGFSFVEDDEVTGEGHWETVNMSDAMYQVPIIHVTDLPCSSYTVTIMPVYERTFAHSTTSLTNGNVNGYVVEDGPTEFWLDAVRVYDPAGNDPENEDFYNATAHEEYKKDNEEDYSLIKVGDALANGSAVYFVGKPNKNIITTEYPHSKYGPNNEVYLKGTSHYITVKVAADKIPSEIYIGASAIDDTSDEPVLEVNSKYTVGAIKTGMDMFYKVTDAVSAADWHEVTDSKGTHWEASIYFRNTNRNAMLRVTNIKLTFATPIDDDTTPSGAYAVNVDADVLRAEVLANIKNYVKAGDVNGDGSIDLKDTALLKKLVAGSEEFDFFSSLAADTDGDGSVNALDVRCLKSVVAGK